MSLFKNVEQIIIFEIFFLMNLNILKDYYWFMNV